MQDRFEAFTVLIAKISRSIRRIKADEMAEYDRELSVLSVFRGRNDCGGAVRKMRGG